MLFYLCKIDGFFRRGRKETRRTLGKRIPGITSRIILVTKDKYRHKSTTLIQKEKVCIFFKSVPKRVRKYIYIYIKLLSEKGRQSYTNQKGLIDRLGRGGSLGSGSSVYETKS